jgi:small subunit ribosomal protein S2
MTISTSPLQPVKIVDLLDAGIHFGHKKTRWNPKMAPYIYGVKEDIHIIDLEQTAALMSVALNAIYDVVRNNGKLLLVGTKHQARDLVIEYAEKCGQYYVAHRWLGGMLTNWKTISRSISKLDNFEKILNNEEETAGYTKKELLDMTRHKDKLLRSLGGIRTIGTKPDLIIILDVNQDHIAVEEASKLNIPIIGVVDTNSDPDAIKYPIPGNDDAIRSIRFYCEKFAEAALAGIRKSLSDSGADLGSAIIDDTNKEEIVAGITKLKPNSKISRTPENTINITNDQ